MIEKMIFYRFYFLGYSIFVMIKVNKKRKIEKLLNIKLNNEHHRVSDHIVYVFLKFIYTFYLILTNLIIPFSYWPVSC